MKSFLNDFFNILKDLIPAPDRRRWDTFENIQCDVMSVCMLSIKVYFYVYLTVEWFLFDCLKIVLFFPNSIYIGFEWTRCGYSSRKSRFHSINVITNRFLNHFQLHSFAHVHTHPHTHTNPPLLPFFPIYELIFDVFYCDNKTTVDGKFVGTVFI